jgi:hypothetical protein
VWAGLLVCAASLSLPLSSLLIHTFFFSLSAPFCLSVPLPSHLTPEQVKFFCTKGFLEVDFTAIKELDITRENCAALAEHLIARANVMLSASGGPADEFSLTEPVSKSYLDAKVRARDPRYRNKNAPYMKTETSPADLRHPGAASENGFGFLGTTYDLPGQVDMQWKLGACFAQLYIAHCNGELTPEQASNLIMHLERFGIKCADKRMPVHTDMCFVKAKNETALTALLDTENPQSYSGKQRIQCVLFLNDSPTCGWYGYGYRPGEERSDRVLGTMNGWSGETWSPVRFDEELLKNKGFKCTEIPAVAGRGVFWACDVPHGNLPCAEGSPTRYALYANYGPRPLEDGEEPSMAIANKVVGLGNHAKGKAATKGGATAAHKTKSAPLIEAAGMPVVKAPSVRKCVV